MWLNALRQGKAKRRLNAPVFPILLVGAAGFEPATSCSRSRRAAKLRYAPMLI